MRGLRKAELVTGIDEMIVATLALLKDLHIVHKKTDFEKLLSAKFPGADITLAKFINNLFNILKPVVAIARRNYPTFFAIIDWAEEIVRKLLSK